MVIEEIMERERAEAKAEGKAEGKAEDILSILTAKGLLCDEVQSRITSETDVSKLNTLLTAAVFASSSEEFMETFLTLF